MSEAFSKEGHVVGKIGNVEKNPYEPAHGLKMREGDQDLPKVNGEKDCQTTFLQRITTDVQTRREVGIQRYGTALQPLNGRDATRDAWEEYIDLGQYMEQMRREREKMIGILTRMKSVGGPDDDALVTYDRLAGEAGILLHQMGIE